MIMKKIAYISIVLFAFGMASCSKQDIKPNSATTVSEPVWRSSEEPVVNEGGDEGGTIVDPNLPSEEDPNKPANTNGG
ncbi:MAG: hypothetical protein ACI837_000725 [Crocinitomicaceae bacterium]|jgi:hypothetical protein